jgi:hypothetical protein
VYVDRPQFATLLLPLTSTGFYPDGNSRNTLENSGKQNPKMGFKSPPSTSKYLILNNLCSKRFGQIQNLDPHRLMSDKSKTTPGDTHGTRPYSHRRLNPKAGYRWRWRRTEFGLRGQRRETESDKGTSANSRSGYHAPRIEKDCGLSAARTAKIASGQMSFVGSYHLSAKSSAGLTGSGTRGMVCRT